MYSFMAMYINSVHLLLDRCLLCEVFKGRSLTVKQLSIPGQFVIYTKCHVGFLIVLLFE